MAASLHGMAVSGRRPMAYEVDQIDKNGTKVEGHVHPATGELLMGYDVD